jgi:hypothetical protein
VTPPAILQVLPRLVSGGVERGTIEIAEAIARAGYVSLVASAGGPMAEELPRVGAEHVTLPLARKDPLALWRNAALLAELARESPRAAARRRGAPGSPRGARAAASSPPITAPIPRASRASGCTTR